MTKYYIVYAHRYEDCYNGWGLEKDVIGIATSKPEAKKIMKTFQKKFPHNKDCNWVVYHADDNNKNIVKCSIEPFVNEYL